MTRTLLAAFTSVPAAGQCVADIIAAGIVPAAMEFMDRRCIEAVEAHSAPGYPRDADGVLIIDADGIPADVDHAIARMRLDQHLMPGFTQRDGIRSLSHGSKLHGGSGIRISRRWGTIRCFPQAESGGRKHQDGNGDPNSSTIHFFLTTFP